MKAQKLNLILCETLTSTNNEVAQWLAHGYVGPGDFVVANYQTAGRGYGTNRWFSSPYKNLLGTLVLAPDHLPARKQFLLTCAASVSIARFLQKNLPDYKVAIKWPNDILVNEKKICGLLIENQIYGEWIKTALMGIGLNINEAEFPEYLNRATSMFLCDHKIRNVEYVAKQVGQAVLDAVADIESLPLLYNQYLNFLYRKGVVAPFQDEKGFFDGVIEGVDEFGRLLINTPTGMRTYGFKEIEYIYI
ncbi:MAG: biotin--[acetyl-CoA-carboxylase] ligase [Bacteroidales bacterium]